MNGPACTSVQISWDFLGMVGARMHKPIPMIGGLCRRPWHQRRATQLHNPRFAWPLSMMPSRLQHCTASHWRPSTPRAMQRNAGSQILSLPSRCFSQPAVRDSKANPDGMECRALAPGLLTSRPSLILLQTNAPPKSQSRQGGVLFVPRHLSPAGRDAEIVRPEPSSR